MNRQEVNSSIAHSSLLYARDSKTEDHEGTTSITTESFMRCKTQMDAIRRSDKSNHHCTTQVEIIVTIQE